MPDRAHYSGTKFRMTAEVGNHAFSGIAAFNSVFEPNALPTASLAVAVGRQISTGKIAAIHEVAPELRRKVPIKVYAEAIQHGSSGGDAENWPNGPFLIFEGNLAGTGWQLVEKEAQFVIHINHWLAALNDASTLSASSHPTNPANIAFPALAQLAGAGAGAGAWTPMALAQTLITNAQLQKDLWEALQKWMLEVAKLATFDNAVAQLFLAGVGGPNDKAVAALQRIKSVGLGLNLPGNDEFAVQIMNGIKLAFAKEWFFSWWNTTYWGKIVGDWSPNFFFSIIPRIEDALAVPFCGPLTAPAFATIKKTEYNQLRQTGILAQQLRAVGLFQPATSQTGAGIDPAGQAVTVKELLGRFPPVGQIPQEGVFLLKQPPVWATLAFGAADFAAAAMGANKVVIGNAFHPNVGDKGPKPANVKVLGNFMNAYAKQWFSLEALKGHTAELSGKLRFDIAPGSNIKVEGGGDKILAAAGKDKLALPFYATVAQVATMIQSDPPRAGTAFSLAHIRTEAENKGGLLALDSPPLYSKRWDGAPLRDG